MKENKPTKIKWILFHEYGLKTSITTASNITEIDIAKKIGENLIEATANGVIVWGKVIMVERDIDE